MKDFFEGFFNGISGAVKCGIIATLVLGLALIIGACGIFHTLIG